MKNALSLTLALGAVLLVSSRPIQAEEFYVATTGADKNPGTKAAPLKTIQRAAELAHPGDIVTVHAGVYREYINPPRGGESDFKRIVYQAAPGEKVEIKGSEIVKSWVKIQGDVWKTTLPNSFFGGFNPYKDLIHGDWFNPKGREHHTGAVYLNGEWLTEAVNLEEVMASSSVLPAWFNQEGRQSFLNPQLWYAKVDEANTTIWARFKEVNPNEQLVEINTRRTVFYSDKPGRNYITVRGFDMSQAATPWAPPTAEQVGLIGTHWSKGWIIESNTVSHSICSGIALGKHGDQYDNTSADTAEGYVKTIERATAKGWNKATIGHHTVRYNTVSHCEQAGIVGSLGAAFSTVTGNIIHDIHVRRLFTGAEMAGIKFHAAIDTVISNNHIYRTCLGLWLDWMAQGTRVSGNLFHDNAGQDMFVEVDHGPFVADNNLFLSKTSLLDMSEGGAYAHNLFAGKIITRPEPSRETPYHPAHSTTVAGLVTIKGGDDRFYNNILIGAGEPKDSQAKPKDPEWAGGYGLWVYDFREFPLQAAGNVYYNGARPYDWETNASVHTAIDPKVTLVEQDGRFMLNFAFGPELNQSSGKIVNTAMLGRAKVSGVAYENADGSPLTIAADFFGEKRDGTHPKSGPFEKIGTAPLTVWPHR